MAEAEAARTLSALLSGIAQKIFFDKAEITEELLREELFPELSPGDFRSLYDRMSGLLKSIAAADMDHAQLEAFLTAQARRQGSGGGGVSAEQTAALSRFWRSQQARVRESLVAQSRWEPSLRGLSWRVDLQTGASRGSPTHSGPVALVEMELGRTGQDSEFVCVELDEEKVGDVLRKMANIQRSIDGIVHRS